MRFIQACLLMLVVIAGRSQSSVVITSTSMPSGGDTLRYSAARLSSLPSYTQTGTGFFWDFSAIEPVAQGVREFKHAMNTPYAFFFLGINEFGEKMADTVGAGPVVFTNFYTFYRKQTSPSAWLADGAGITYNSIPIPNYYSDRDELYLFPLSYPKYDSTTFKFSTSSHTMVPFKYSKTGHRITTVDGWGTIATPYGTVQCIRLVTTQYSMDSIKYNSGPFSFGFPNYQRSYQWLTPGVKIPFLEITGSLTQNGFTPAYARYRDIPRVTSVSENPLPLASFELFPNPVQDEIRIRSSVQGPCRIELCSAEGKLIRSFVTAGEEEIVVDTRGFSPGLYLLNVSHNAVTRSFKFLKQ